MKIVFLDVDGVLNCKTTKERFHGCIGLCPVKCALFRRIVRETGCKIVLSSTWRKYAHYEKHLWETLNLPAGVVIGKTPQLRDHTKNGVTIPMFRGDEISAWLSTNPKPSRYVIMDDNSDMTCHMDRLIKSEWETGLTEEIASKVIAELTP